MKKVLFMTSAIFVGAMEASYGSGPQFSHAPSGSLNPAERLIMDVLGRDRPASASVGTVKEKRERLFRGVSPLSAQKKVSGEALPSSSDEVSQINDEITDAKRKIQRLSDALTVTGDMTDETRIPIDKDLRDQTKKKYDTLSPEGQREFRKRLHDTRTEWRGKLQASQKRLKAHQGSSSASAAAAALVTPPKP